MKKKHLQKQKKYWRILNFYKFLNICIFLIILILLIFKFNHINQINKHNILNNQNILLAQEYSNNGTIYDGNYKLKEAIVNFKKAIELDSKNPNHYVKIGWSYTTTEEHQKAINSFLLAENLSKLTPITIHPGHNLGLAILNIYQKEYDLANQNIQKAIEYEKNPYEVYVYVAPAYRRMLKYQEAERLYHLALEDNPTSDLAYYFFGELKFYQNNFTEAKKLLKKSLSFNPKQIYANEILGIIYYRENNFTMAKIYLETYLDLRLDPDLNLAGDYMLAKIYLQENKREKAKEILEDIKKYYFLSDSNFHKRPNFFRTEKDTYNKTILLLEQLRIQ